jgi:hypothetical protein
MGNDPVNRMDPNGGTDGPDPKLVKGNCMCSTVDSDGNRITFIPENKPLPIGFPIMKAINGFWDFLVTGSPVGMRRFEGQEVNWDGTIASEGRLVEAHLPDLPIGPGAPVKIWSATKSLSSVKNAFSHWVKHSKEFPELLNAKQYVQAAKNFLTKSPTGTLTKVRANGDILKYHPGTNTFGVLDASGAPRTMFRPADGLQYWLKQLN